MKKNIKKTLIYTIILLVISCERNINNPKMISGHWGHLPIVTQTTPSKMLLSHLKAEDSYKVCVPNYLLEKKKGLEEEIKAAINIWAFYMKRQIKVEVTWEELPRPQKNQTETDLMNLYYDLCPSDISLVLGESFFSDQAIGKTMPLYTYRFKNGKKEIINYKRALFLKAGDIEWKTISEVTQQDLQEDEILEMMKKRNKYVYLDNENEFLTLQVLTHEFGHIWGLCDQYELNDHQTNCDPENSDIDEEGHVILNKDSIMSKNNFINKIFLTDDDINGIQNIALRNETNNNNTSAEDLNAINIAKITPPRDISFARVKNINIHDLQFEITLSLVISSEQSKITFNIFDDLSKKWIKVANFELDNKINTKNFSLRSSYYKKTSPVKYEISITSEADEVILSGDF